MQRLIKYCLKHRYQVKCNREGNIAKQNGTVRGYDVVILIMDFPKCLRPATLLYMPLIRPGDEKEEVIKKETNQGKACCYNKLLKANRVSGL